MQGVPAGADAALYEGFLEVQVVDPLTGLSDSVADMRVLAEQLWPLYVQPLREGKVRCGTHRRRR